MKSTEMRQLRGGLAIAGALTVALSGPAQADDEVKITSRPDCTGAKAPDTIKPGSGTLTFIAPGTCTFLVLRDTEPGGPIPLVKKGTEKVEVAVTADRKQFSVAYDFSAATKACLNYVLILTTGPNDVGHAGSEIRKPICSDAPWKK
jgi:hypothetical protein